MNLLTILFFQRIFNIKTVIFGIIMAGAGLYCGTQAAETEKSSDPVMSAGPKLNNCRIVVSETATLKSSVDELADLLRQRGAKVSIISPQECLDPSGLRWRDVEDEGQGRLTSILVGNILTNRALLPLYAAFLDFSDAYYPGGDGYEIRTVMDAPVRGTDSIVLGASSEKGVLRAIGRFLEIIKGLDKPLHSILEVELAPELSAKLKKSYTSDERICGFLYGLTGEEKYAKMTRNGFLKTQAQGKETFYNVIGDDYAWESFVRSWALVRDSGIFSADEINVIHRNLFNTLIHIENHPSVKHDGTVLGSRHTSMGTSGFLAIVRYLLRRADFQGEDLARLNRYKTWGESYFAVAMTAFHDDSDDVQSFYGFQPVANYALETGMSDYFKTNSGLSTMELALRRAYVCTDNMGYYCGTGLYEETRPGTIASGIMLGYPLAMAAYVNLDAGATWLLKHFRGTEISSWGVLSVAGTHAFDMGEGVKEKEPLELLGVLRLPLGEYHYSKMPRTVNPKNPQAMYMPLPYDKTFDKLCFRDKFAADGQYLVLEGIQARLDAETSPFDGNSIIRYTDQGVPWLVANTDFRGNYYRNAVFVDGGEKELPGLAGSELVGQASVGNVHLAVSLLREYNDTEWARNILWLRGRAFGVIDTVVSKTPGDLSVICTYKSAPPAELYGREWIARSGAAEFHLLNVDDLHMTSCRDGVAEGASIPTYLRQVLDLKGKGVGIFRNMFFVSTPERPQHFETRPLGQNGLLIMDGSNPALFAVRGDGKGNMKYGPFETDAESFYIGTEGVCAVGGTQVKYEGKSLRLGQAAPPEVIEELKKIWAGALVSSTVAQKKIAVALDPVWTYNQMLPRRPIILNLLVAASETPITGSLGELVDGLLSSNYGNVSWVNPKGLTLNFDLGQSMDVSDVEYATGQISSPNVFPVPAQLKDKQAKVEFSDDNFRNDIRGGAITFQAGFTFELLHKGQRFAMGRWRLSGVKEKARYVRIVFPPGAIGIREVYIRQGKGSEAQFGPSLVTDWDGTGKPDSIITTDTGEMVVLDSNGKKRWSHTFSGAATCLNAGVLEAGRPGVLIVGTRESRLYCFSKEGEQLWMIDYGNYPAPEWNIPDLAMYNECTIPFSINFTAPGKDGKRTVFLGHYCFASLVSPDGKITDFFRAYGECQKVSLINGMDFTGDGSADALLGNSWGRIPIVDLVTHTAKSGLIVPAGQALALQGWDSSDPKNPSVLFASENGIGVLRPSLCKKEVWEDGIFDWQKLWMLMSCVTPVNPNGPGQILVGKKDGLLLVLDEKGEVKNRIMLGDEIRSIVVTAASPLRFWVATGGDIFVIDGNLNILKRIGCVALKLQKLDDKRLLILSKDGTISAVSCSDAL